MILMMHPLIFRAKRVSGRYELSLEVACGRVGVPAGSEQNDSKSERDVSHMGSLTYFLLGKKTPETDKVGSCVQSHRTRPPHQTRPDKPSARPAGRIRRVTRPFAHAAMQTRHLGATRAFPCRSHSATRRVWPRWRVSPEATAVPMCHFSFRQCFESLKLLLTRNCHFDRSTASRSSRLLFVFQGNAFIVFNCLTFF